MIFLIVIVFVLFCLCNIRVNHLVIIFLAWFLIITFLANILIFITFYCVNYYC